MLGWLGKILSWWRGPGALGRLERVLLADGVVRTLFSDYAEHRRSERGREEIGWVLLGLRHGNEAIALAALPAGARRDAGTAHVQFNSDAQALAARILRQKDKRLQVIGVVHTHPGGLTVPSDGDLNGDRIWVRQLRGQDGVFGIGTDGPPTESAAHVQICHKLRLDWYALAANERDYRPVPVRATAGEDVASFLRPIWSVIECHATPLNAMCRQLASVQFEVIDDGPTKALAARITLTEPNQQLRVLFHEGEARYYWDRNGDLIAIDPHESQVDRAVYLILAELAQSSAPREIFEGA